MHHVGGRYGFGYIEIEEYEAPRLRVDIKTQLKWTHRPAGKQAPPGFKSGKFVIGEDLDGAEYYVFFDRLYKLERPLIHCAIRRKDAPVFDDLTGEWIEIYDFGAIEGRYAQWLRGTHVMHRVDGPAYIADARGKHIESWLRDNKLHRSDGPASRLMNVGVHGIHHSEDKWWVNGNRINADEIAAIIERHELPRDHTKWDDAEKTLMRMALP